MAVYDIRTCPNVRLMGRFDSGETGFNMYWGGACAEMCVKSDRLYVTIEGTYSELFRPYISFEVDGLRSDTFSPLEGIHEYNVFMGMNPNASHTVRITKESPSAIYYGQGVRLLSLRTDGEFMPLQPKKRRIEFIGDSVTVGEGCRGPQSWCEGTTMAFSSTDNYTRMVSDTLNAEYQTMAVCGWGITCGYDNDPKQSLPCIYDKVYADSDVQYNFAFAPDTVVVALGANDDCALNQPPYTDPISGKTYVLRKDDISMKRVAEDTTDFIEHIHEKNPYARIVWLSFIDNSPLCSAIQNGVEKAALRDINASFHKVFDVTSLPNEGIGSRRHPGIVTHKLIAKKLVEIL